MGGGDGSGEEKTSGPGKQKRRTEKRGQRPAVRDVVTTSGREEGTGKIARLGVGEERI